MLGIRMLGSQARQPATTAARGTDMRCSGGEAR
jgi:hypothetical protein